MSLLDLFQPVAKIAKPKGQVHRLVGTEVEDSEAKSARMKALHADPEFKAKVSKAASARMKALHADPEFKAKVSKAASARMKALNADPEFKAKTAARMKALNADPEFRARAKQRKAKRIAAKIAELQSTLAAMEESQ